MSNYDQDRLYGTTAIQLGLVNPEEIRHCGQILQQHGGRYSLEQILLQRGTLSHEAAQHIRQNLMRMGGPAPTPSSFGAIPVVSSYAPMASPHFQPNGMTHSDGSGMMGVYRPAAYPPSGGYENAPVTPSSAISMSRAGPTTSALIQVPVNLTPMPPSLYQSGGELALPEVGGTFGRYRIESILGKGGMGIVYKAVHQDLSRVVALKMLVTGAATNEKQLKRFYIEARAAARLSHPNIVPIHDVGELDGLHYFTMDYVAGTTLAAALQDRTFTETEILEFVKTLAEALDYAHANDVIHRDLKPANILIDDRGRPRITDFGIAKDIRAGDGETMSGEVLGTPAYMSPEQADGSSRTIDGRADLFSLGSILYEMLFHEQAFNGSTQYAIVTQVLTHNPEPSVLELEKVSAEAEAICFKCLAKNRADRYARGRELAEDIDRVLAGKKPQAPLRRAARSRIRRKVLLVAGAAALTELALWALLFGHTNHQTSALAAAGRELEKRAHDTLATLQEKWERERHQARGLIRQAEQLAEEGDAKGAIERAREALRLDPDSAPLAFALARLLFEYQKDTDAALETVESLLKDEGVAKQAHKLKVECLWAKQEVVLVRQALEALVKKFPDPDAFVRRHQGFLAEFDGNWRGAVEEYRVALEQAPNDHGTRARMAFALAKIGLFDQAAMESAKAIRGDARLAVAWHAKALAHKHKRAYSEAREAAVRARDLEERRREELDPFITDLDRAIKEDQIRAQKTLEEEQRRRLKPPVKQPQDERHQEMHASLIKALAMMKTKDEASQKEALACVNRARAIGINCGESHAQHGYYLVLASDLAAAEAELKTALEQGCGTQDASKALVIFELLGEAVAALPKERNEAGQRIAAFEGSVTLYRGQCREAMGRTPEAIADYERALKLSAAPAEKIQAFLDRARKKLKP